MDSARHAESEKRSRRRARTREGSTLISVTILLGTMTVLALVFLRVAQQAGREQDAGLESARATLLAEAGISEAMEALRAGQSGNVGTVAAPAYLGGGVLWVEATDLGGGRTQLDALAMKEGGRAALRVVVEDEAAGGGDDGDSGPGNGFMTMLFANKGLDLDQGVTIDSYDSSLGTYASQATNTYGGTAYAGTEGGAASNASVTVNSQVKVFGDVSCGPGIAPTVAADAYVSGSTSSLSETIPLTQITVPVVLPTGVYTVANNATKTLTPGTYHFVSVTQGKFSKLRITGPATLVWDSYVTGANATLELDCTNGPITIYDTGLWSVDKNYTVGPAPGSPVDAAFLISSPGTVQFDSGSKIQIGFYAPNATIQVDQGAECWGALVADQININQNTRFHFDKNLTHFDLPWEIPDTGGSSSEADPHILSWSKIEFPIHEFSANRRDPFALLKVKRAELRSPAEAWEEPSGEYGDYGQ